MSFPLCGAREEWGQAPAWARGGLALLLGLALGMALAGQYGQSRDDWGDARYGADSLRAYRGETHFFDYDDRYLYGPSHFMFSEVVSRALAAPPLRWHVVDGRHLANFFAFLVGCAALYALARRLLTRAGARLALLLFVTQPVLFGHAFINQKDIPFMAYFTASVALGLAAADRWAQASSMPGPAIDRAEVMEDWRRVPTARKAAALGAIALSLALAFDLLRGGIVLQAGRGLLAQAYEGTAPAWAMALFRRTATDAYKTPLAIYLGKLERVYDWARVPVLALLLGGALAAPGLVLRRSMSSLWIRYRAALAWALLAGGAVGLATAIRVAGPLAGLLVALYLARRAGWGALPALALYGLAAAASTYLLWPTLWAAPASAFLESLKTMARFRPLPVLFEGRWLTSYDLPAYYLPKMMLLQLTLPVIALVIVGAGRALARSRRGVSLLPLLMAVWFGIPFLGVVLFRTPIYNSFRQLLFILPPLFLLIGLGAEALWALARGWAAQAALVVLLIAPSAAGILRLHPYEYVYFNALAGGVAGAEGKYDLEYWCTSYREATAYLNDAAPPGASVLVFGADTSVRSFAREDLTVLADYQPVDHPDYAMACTRGLYAAWFYPDYVPVFRVGRFGATFAELRAAP